MMIDWSEIVTSINQQISNEITISNSNPPLAVGGGCINQAWKITDQEGSSWFIKTNQPNLLDMFEAEQAGLEEIRASETFCVPRTLCSGQTSRHSFLVMEYLELKSNFDSVIAGRQLAEMHQHTQESFGWKRNNTIGSTAQINTYDNNWVKFWQENRLEFQLKLALNKGLPSHAFDAGMELSQLLDQFFTSYHPCASLLHGDLWGGNCSSDQAGKPIIYDPAVYYGDRETDLAMTELFGGFGRRFYASYHECLPLDSGYSTRKKLYNLYHILNHFNLFGGGYGRQSAGMIDDLLSELQ